MRCRLKLIRDIELPDLASDLSYEEAEAGFEASLQAFSESLDRGAAGASTPSARVQLDKAVAYASRMNEICGGPHNSEFKQALRSKLLLGCLEHSVATQYQQTGDHIPKFKDSA